MAKNAVELTPTLFYQARLIRRVDSANSDVASGEVDGQSVETQSSSTPLSTPSSSTTATSALTTSSSSSSSSSPLSSSTTSSSIPLTRGQSVNTSKPPIQHDAPTGSQASGHGDDSSASTTATPKDNGSGASQVSTTTSSSSSKPAVNVSPSGSSGPSTPQSTIFTGMISAPSNTLGPDDTSSTSLQPASPPSNKNIPIIIGSVAGGLIFLVLCFLLFFKLQRKRRKQEVETLRWEAVYDPADEPHSPMSSESGHGLIETRMIPLGEQVRLHWMHPAYMMGPIREEPESRGNSPGAASTVSTMSTVTFARPDPNYDPSQIRVAPTGHYMPSSSEVDHISNSYTDDAWFPQARKTRPSLMTLVHEK